MGNFRDSLLVIRGGHVAAFRLEQRGLCRHLQGLGDFTDLHADVNARFRVRRYRDIILLKCFKSRRLDADLVTARNQIALAIVAGFIG